MRQLNKVESILFVIGAVMMVVGVVCTTLRLIPTVMTPVFAAGAFLFSCIQLSQRYSGDNITLRRLRRIMDFANIMFLIAALMMVENTYHFVWEIMSQHYLNDPAALIDFANNYIRYTQNNWVVALLIGAILEMYSMTRFSHEAAKEEK